MYLRIASTRRFGFVALALAATLTFVTRPAAAKGPEVFPLKNVKKGMKGYGLTVFQGTTIERFDWEVVAIAKQQLPGIDLIIFKSDDPKMTLPGVAAGMSGSPMYLDGKVVCALSYGWRFTKITLGMCTPIETMLAESKTPLRGVETTPLASLDEWQRYQPLDRYDGGRDALASARRPDAWITQAPLPTAPLLPADPDGPRRASVPLTVAGLTSRSFDAIRSIFSPYGLEAMQAGGIGGSNPAGGPSYYEMGGMIGVQLVRGDFSAMASGTVSYVDGTNVLAFGHPLFTFGETFLPTALAEVSVIVPSAQSAFKMSSPLRPLGALVQDRASMTQIDTTKTPTMIPVDVTVEGPVGIKTWHTEVARNKFWTPQMAVLSVSNAAGVLYPDVADAIVAVESTLVIKGFRPLNFVDYMYSPDGASANAIASARALRVLTPILFNPWSPVTIERLAVKVSVTYKADYANVVELRAPAATVPAGKKFDLEVVLQPFGAAPYVVKIPVTMPERLAGQQVRVDVVPGDFARLDVAAPENTEQLIEALRRTYPGNVLVVTVSTADEGTAIGGKIVPNLPPSAIDTVRPGASSGRVDQYKSLIRVVTPTPRVVQGRAELLLTVDDR
jgi:hypothetical protein